MFQLMHTSGYNNLNWSLLFLLAIADKFKCDNVTIHWSAILFS